MNPVNSVNALKFCLRSLQWFCTVSCLHIRRRQICLHCCWTELAHTQIERKEIKWRRNNKTNREARTKRQACGGKKTVVFRCVWMHQETFNNIGQDQQSSNTKWIRFFLKLSVNFHLLRLLLLYHWQMRAQCNKVPFIMQVLNFRRLWAGNRRAECVQQVNTITWYDVLLYFIDLYRQRRLYRGFFNTHIVATAQRTCMRAHICDRVLCDDDDFFCFAGRLDKLSRLMNSAARWSKMRWGKKTRSSIWLLK